MDGWMDWVSGKGAKNGSEPPRDSSRCSGDGVGIRAVGWGAHSGLPAPRCTVWGCWRCLGIAKTLGSSKKSPGWAAQGYLVAVSLNRAFLLGLGPAACTPAQGVAV